MRGFLSFLFDTLVPPRCLHCGAATQRAPGCDGIVVPGGWPAETLEFLAHGPVTPGAPGASAEILCGGCWMRLAPAAPCAADNGAALEPVLRVTAPFLINDALLELIRFLKFEGGRRAAQPLGWWMAAALGRPPRVPAGAVLVPVPLHGARRALRGYNQAELLAATVAAATGLPLRPALLRRTRRTRPQSKLGAEARAANVHGAFAARPEAAAEPRHVILVDDLVTTGETVAACAAALRASSGAGISVLAAGISEEHATGAGGNSEQGKIPLKADGEL